MTQIIYEPFYNSEGSAVIIEKLWNTLQIKL